MLKRSHQTHGRASNGLFTLTALWMTTGFFPAVHDAYADIVAQGSVVCDTNRVELVPKDVKYHLLNKAQIVVYCGGVNANDSRIKRNSPHVWKFRRVGGTWTDVTSTSEVKLVDISTLAHGAVVTSVNRRATLGDPETFIESGCEFEADGLQSVSAQVKTNKITESQIALSFADALDAQEYELACEWGNFNSPLLVVYAATITIPALVSVGLPESGVVRYMSAAPNPFQGQTTISYALARSGAVNVGVYDTNGRRVTTLDAGLRTAGTKRFVWDGTDARGHAIPPGVYLINARTDEGVFRSKVVKRY